MQMDSDYEGTQTNLEYLRTLSAEKLTDWFYNQWLLKQAKYYTDSYLGLIIWLKQEKV